jgi:hypothetical protein
MSVFGLLGCFLPAPSYIALALVSGMGSTIVAEARDFRAADIQVEVLCWMRMTKLQEAIAKLSTLPEATRTAHQRP